MALPNTYFWPLLNTTWEGSVETVEKSWESQTWHPNFVNSTTGMRPGQARQNTTGPCSSCLRPLDATSGPCLTGGHLDRWTFVALGHCLPSACLKLACHSQWCFDALIPIPSIIITINSWLFKCGRVNKCEYNLAGRPLSSSSSSVSPSGCSALRGTQSPQDKIPHSPVDTAHCTLSTHIDRCRSHRCWTLHTVDSTQHTHCSLHTTHYTLHTTHWILHNSYNTLQKCRLPTVHFPRSGQLWPIPPL